MAVSRERKVVPHNSKSDLPLSIFKKVSKLFQNSSVLRKSPDKSSESQEDDQDPARVSRLFYLQLYSSVYNAATKPEVKNTAPEETQSKTNRAQKILSSVTNTLLRNNAKNNKDNLSSTVTSQGQHASLKRNASEDFERDAEGSMHESVIVEKRSPPSIIAEEVPTLKMVSVLWTFLT